ncbi:MAG: flagellar motor switch protein FliN [Demequina sp.]|uniref:flagellar motor switch protein FliN n=1 Tax=Demequina sp. TaxID=2050685 RepID=UPI003A84B0E6
MTIAAPSSLVASELASHLPTPTPLSASPYDPAEGPDASVLAVTAHHVGAVGTDFVVVAGESTAAALEGAGPGLTTADLLTPALEAAAAVVGPGVLDVSAPAPLGDAFADPDMDVFALRDAEGVTQAWLGVRARVAETTQAAPAVLTDDEARARMRVLQDVELVLTAEIGRTRLPMRQVLDLVPGTVLELDRAAGAPADVMVNGRLVARGEIVVVDEDYGIRVTEIVSAETTR